MHACMCSAGGGGVLGLPGAQPLAGALPCRYACRGTLEFILAQSGVVKLTPCLIYQMDAESHMCPPTLPVNVFALEVIG